MFEAAAVIVIMAFMAMSIAVVGESSAGVKKGNWVEYSMKTSGATPAAQDFTWA